MSPTRKTALIAGVFYLITFVASIPAVFLLSPVLDHAGYIVSGGQDTRVVLGCTLDFINAIACIGTAVVLFPVVKRQSEAVALGFVTSRMFEATIIVIGIVCLLGVVTLRNDLAGGGADHSSLVIVGRTLVAVRNWTFTLGPGLIPAVNALLLGYLLYRSRLVPRLIPEIGLLGAPLLIVSAFATMFNHNHKITALAVISTIPIFIWELSLGIWLVARGFDPSSPILTQSESGERTEAVLHATS